MSHFLKRMAYLSPSTIGGMLNQDMCVLFPDIPVSSSPIVSNPCPTLAATKCTFSIATTEPKEKVNNLSNESKLEGDCIPSNKF